MAHSMGYFRVEIFILPHLWIITVESPENRNNGCHFLMAGSKGFTASFE
jgi:hypothetical protein